MTGDPPGGVMEPPEVELSKHWTEPEGMESCAGVEFALKVLNTNEASAVAATRVIAMIITVASTSDIPRLFVVILVRMRHWHGVGLFEVVTAKP